MSLIAIQRVINSFSSDSAFTIIGRIINTFIHYSYLSLWASISTYSGQNIGVEKEERVKLGYIKTISNTSLFALVVFILFQTFTKNIIEIFGNDPYVIQIISTGLRIYCMFYIFLGFIHVTRNLLNCSGETKFSIHNGMVECLKEYAFLSH